MSWRLTLRLIVILVAAFLLGVGVMFVFSINRGSNNYAGNEEGKNIELSIELGEGTRIIADKLQRAGLIDSPRTFYVYLILSGRRSRIYPGHYSLENGSTLRQIVNQLTSGKVNQLTIRILEGWRLNDIANEIAKKSKITAEEFLALAPVATYEGYLFPDTYYFTPETTAPQMIKIMRDNFDKRTIGLSLTRDDVIMASIVEREAARDSDRAKIAAVYLNRQTIDMALEADPTVQYAKGSWAPIKLVDYRAVVSPYNTYLNRGLPPSAIASPSLKSLIAVKQPDSHDYFYFFTPSNGETVFSRSLEEHNLNKAKFLR